MILFGRRRVRRGIGRARVVFVAVGLAIALVASVVAQADEAPALDREARLAEGLADYAAALAEPARDTRLAGFARAERAFASLVADGVESAALYTNLGNAALQAQAPGRAVVAYHRALALDPDAATARQNLAHVRARLPAWVPRPAATDDLRGVFDPRRFPEPQRSTAAALCFLLAALCVALAVRRSEGAWRGLAILFGVGWALALSSVVLPQADDEDRLAVLTGEEVPARSADSALAPLAMPEPLPAGVEVDLLETRNEWARVRLANGRDVWVRRSSVTLVAG